MSSKPPPSPEFLARVRSSVFLWLGKNLGADLTIGPAGFEKLLELYEESFVKGLTGRIQTTPGYPPAEEWWERGIPDHSNPNGRMAGEEYGQKKVRAMCECIEKKLPSGGQITPKQLDDCFKEVSKKTKASIDKINERLGADIPFAPIFCE